VYEARHLPTGQRVALKLLPVDFQQAEPAWNWSEEASRLAAHAGDRLHRFKREFRVLADMNHPNLVRLHTLEVDGGQWYFTMDLIDGDDFLDYVRPRGKLDESRLRSAMKQLVAGVLALHRHHVVHRDLKPTNLLIRSDGHLVILDFGLVAKLESADRPGVVSRFNGTPAYAAPEQATAFGTTASDWYAVGTMLFEGLTGDRPFRGNDVEILAIKQSTDAPSLLDRPDIPRDLAVICRRLLDRDPRARPDGSEIAELFTVGQGAAGGPPRDGAGQLVGREEQLQLLQTAFDDFQRTAQTIAVFISGKSGEGKTILAEQFLAGLRGDDRFTILNGRCYDRESVPFKALDGVVDALASYWQSLPNDQAAALLPDDIMFLAHLFPVLRRVTMVALSPGVNVAAFDRQQVRQRAFAALRHILCRMSGKRPLVIFCDDLQWGDDDSAEALAQAMVGPQAPALFFLGSYRSDESEGSRFMGSWKRLLDGVPAAPPQYDLKLTPLTVQQCIDLLIDRVGIDSEEIRQRGTEFAGVTDGNPYLMLELVQGFDASTETFEAVQMPEVVRRKLSRLPSEAESLLRVVAVSGKALAINEAASAAGCLANAAGTITPMRNENLLRTIEQSSGLFIETYHDKIRHTVLRSLTPDETRSIHRAIGTAIEQSTQVNFAAIWTGLQPGADTESQRVRALPRVNDLAYHFEAAGDQQRTVAYALLAAEQAKVQFAIEVAIEKFQIARRMSDVANQRIRYRTAVGLGESLFLVGRFEEAAETLAGAEELTSDVLEQSAVRQTRAEIAYRQGSLLDAIAGYEKILVELGITVPGSRWAALRAVAGAASIRVLRGTPWLRRLRWARSKSTAEPDRRTVFAIRALSQVVYPYFWRDVVRSVWACFTAFNLAEDFPVSPVLAAVHGQCANAYMVFLGMHRRAVPHYECAMRVAEQVDDFVLQADVSRTWGFGCFASGQFLQADQRLQSAAQLYQTKILDAARLTHTRYWLACVKLYLGELDQAARMASGIFELAVTLGMDRLAHQALETWTRAVDGRLPFEKYRSCFPLDRESHCATIQLLTAESVWHLAHGRTAEALRLTSEAVEIMRRNWLLHTHTGFAVSTFARACREHGDSLRSVDPAQSRKLYRRALRATRWAILLKRFVLLDEASFLREHSRALAALGKYRSALRFARQSCDVAERQQAKYELAQSRLVAAELSLRLGRVDAADELDRVRVTLRAFHRERPSETSASSCLNNDAEQ
jgi:tetratricopeptide (TPR) repeat protein